MLSSSDAVSKAAELHRFHTVEREHLDRIRLYWKGRQLLPAVIPGSAPPQVRTMARIARVNVTKIVVDSLAQSLFVDGFRAKSDAEESATWATWQANKMDARQTGIHRAAVAYGASYAIVLPGDPLPVIRGASPRNLTAVYADDPDWPVWALERCGYGQWKLYDNEAIYYLSGGKSPAGTSGTTDVASFSFVRADAHDMGVTPVVRYLDEADLDADDDVPSLGHDYFGGFIDHPMRGQVAPLMEIQDQINLTTFGLLVAQHYAAFRQRYVIGWTADDERELLKASASQLWTIDDDAGEVKIGEFSQTDLSGYIDSREKSLKHAAALSQTPVHELIGDLVNLSAEALAAAEQGHDRKVDERKTLLGESHEQMLWLVGKLTGTIVPDDAQVVWRDTSARAFAATIDGLGKLAQMLGIPAQELWERVPGATQQDVQRWKTAAESGDSFQQLQKILDRQSEPPGAVPASA